MLNLKERNPKNGIQIDYTWSVTLAVRSGMSVAASFTLRAGTRECIRKICFCYDSKFEKGVYIV
jgi:hypothetical protein